MSEPLDLDAIEREMTEARFDDFPIHIAENLLAEVRRLRNIEHRLSRELADERDTLEQLAVHHGWDVTGWRHFREALRLGAIAGLEV